MIETDGEKGSGIFMLMVRHDGADDDLLDKLLMYIKKVNDLEYYLLDKLLMVRN